MKLKYFAAFLFLLFMSAIFGSVQTFAQTQKLTVGNLKGTNYSGLRLLGSNSGGGEKSAFGENCFLVGRRKNGDFQY